MEADGHDTVGGIEGLLHTIAVVDVNVDIEHSSMVSALNMNYLLRLPHKMKKADLNSSRIPSTISEPYVSTRNDGWHRGIPLT